MLTLLLQCVAPLQSWGTQSDYIVRDTGREPSKSGVIGLICAALGRDRSEPVDDLAALQMGVRIDQEGKILRDYHTITHKTSRKSSTVLSTRYYLMDAMFLVGLSSQNETLLTQIEAALKRPHWTLFFGRKSCVPARPPWLPSSLTEQSLEDAIRNFPWLGQNRAAYDQLQKREHSLRLVFDDLENGDTFPHDLPISFARNARQFHPRRTCSAFSATMPAFAPERSYPAWQ